MNYKLLVRYAVNVYCMHMPTNYYLATNEKTAKLINSARSTLGRLRATKGTEKRVMFVISAEDTIARLRAYNAVGLLYGKFAELCELERRLRRAKLTPAIRRELWL